MASNAVAIAPGEVTYHPTSLIDPHGRLFWWRGHLHRCVSEEMAPLYRELIADGFVERVVAKGLLVDTEATPYTVGPCPLVLRHRALPTLSYAYEWCAEMLRDAAVTVLDLQQELVGRGLTLQDAHAWNVVFDGSRPVWVDFGSIAHASGDRWSAYDEFCRFFLYPLRLMAAGHGRIARWLLHDFTTGVLETDVRGLSARWPLGASLQGLPGRAKDLSRKVLPPTVRRAARRLIESLRTQHRGPGLHALIGAGDVSRLRRHLDAIHLPQPKGEWAEYYDGAFPGFAPSEAWTAKHHGIHEILCTVRPASVLDIGSNRGWFAQLAAHGGARVVALDVDEPSLTRLYLDCRAKALPILPLLVDFKSPSPGLGPGNTWFLPAVDRLRSDMVLGLALVHHLVFVQRLSLEQIVDGLSRFTKKWLVVEFIPPSDQYVQNWWSPQFSWYTADNFLSALRRRFRIVQVRPSHPPERVLIFCEAIEAGRPGAAG